MIDSIRNRQTFAELRSTGIRVRSGAVRMSYVRLCDSLEPQVGFTLGRRFGNAVERNRSRRRLKAAFDEVWHEPDRTVPDPGAFLLNGTRRLLTDDYQRLLADVSNCFDQLIKRTRVN